MNDAVFTPQKTMSLPLAERLDTLASLLEDQKAGDIFLHQCPNAICDAVIIVTATSRRHAQGLADAVLRQCQQPGHEFLRMAGYDSAQWILLDCNDVLIHIFQEDARQLYRLEDLCFERTRHVSSAHPYQEPRP